MPRRKSPDTRTSARGPSVPSYVRSFATPDTFLAECQKAQRLLKEKRKAIFAKIDVQTGGRSRKMSSFDAYISLLGREAVNGDTNAARELTAFNKRRQDTEAKRRIQLMRAESPLAPLYEKQKQMASLATIWGGIIYLRLLPEIWKAFEAVKGRLTFSDSLVPPGLDLSVAATILSKEEAKTKRSRRPSGDGGGYCKPPKKRNFLPA